MSAKTALGVATKCPECGASLEATPDTVVYVCRYCGWAGVPKGQALELEGIEAAKKEDVEKEVKKFISSKAGPDAEIKEEKSVFLPFWVVELHASTNYNGYRNETRGSGKNTYTVHVPVKGVLEEDTTVPVYARALGALFGLTDVKNKVAGAFSQSKKLDIVKAAKEADVLNPEIDEEEGEESAKTFVEDDHRDRVEEMTSKLYDCYTTTQVTSKRLMLFPVMQVKYELDGKIYRICADASKRADERVLKAELPISRRARVATAIAVALVILMISIIAIAADSLVQAGLATGGVHNGVHSENPAVGFLMVAVAVGVPSAAAAFIGWWGVRRATAEQKVWERGKTRFED